MNNSNTPMTVRDLGNMAEARGVKITDLMPPEGFHPDNAGEFDLDTTWSGPKFEGEGWKVTSHWTIEGGLSFYVDGDGDNAIRGAEAGKIAAALAEVAAMI